MEALFSAFKKGDYLKALNILLTHLKSEGIIDGAVLFYDKPLKALVITDRERITGETLEKIEGIAKSYVSRALELKSEIFEENLIVRRGSESSLFYQITSLYVSPVFKEEEVEGIIYIDRIRNEKPFTEAEKLWLKFIALIFQQFLEISRRERLVEDLQQEIWIGSSPASRSIREKIRKLAGLSPILILGETGTGKNLAAELLYRFSGRKGKFVVVSCPNVPESLFEAELFGCRKGAYTGAEERKGLVGEANGGTLFLDEISEIPYHLQAKLLRFIETGVYRRLGEDRERKADVQIICASNRNLEEEIEKGNFRKDLYFRVSAFVIEIPPLRKRREDIAEIAMVYLRRNGFAITEGALELLKNKDFPGNVRQLQNFLNRLMVEAESNLIDEKLVEDLSKETAEKGKRLDDIWKRLEEGESFWEVVKKPYLKRELNREEVRSIIKRGLEKAGTYKKLCKLFNIPEEEYHNFMTFLHKQKLIEKRK